MRRWLVSCDIKNYYYHNNIIGMQKEVCDKGNQPFSKIESGDTIVYCDFLQGITIGIFKIDSEMMVLRDSDDPYYKDSYYFIIKPYHNQQLPEGTFFNFRRFCEETPRFKEFLDSQKETGPYIEIQKDLLQQIESDFFNPRYHIQIKETTGDNGPTGWRVNPDLIAGLLDYYNSRAVSFASLLVASIFGLITLSAIIQTVYSGFSDPITTPLNYTQLVVSIILYILFSIAGVYMLKCYSYYTGVADKVKMNAIQVPYLIDLKKITFWDDKHSRFTNLLEILHKTEKDHAHWSIKKAVQKTKFLVFALALALTLLAIFIYWNLVAQLMPFLP